MPDSVLFRVQEVEVDLSPYDLPGPDAAQSRLRPLRPGGPGSPGGHPGRPALCRPCAGGAYFKAPREIVWDHMNWSPQPQDLELDSLGNDAHLKDRPPMLSLA